MKLPKPWMWLDNEGEDEDSIVSKAYAWIKIKGICLHDYILTEEQCFGFMEHTCN